jgi:hypothetical protein
LPEDALTHDLHPRTNVHSSALWLVPLLGLLQGCQPVLERLMLPTYGYRQLVSQDKLILVQIFTDLTTGEHLRTTVSQRVWPFLDWLPATEVEMVE